MNLRDIYELGLLFEKLNNILASKKRGVPGDIYKPAYTIMTKIVVILEKFNIAYNVRHYISNWLDILIGRRKYNEEEISNLPSQTKEWIALIKSEITDIPVIKLQTNSLLNPKKLLKGAELFFKPDIWVRLTLTAQKDLQDATKCLLCNLPTPSVMISLRAIEDVQRQYYKYKTKQEPGRKNWKTILNELLATSEKGDPKYNVNKTLLGLLDYIRKNERNVAEHPDKRFDQDEAEGIFSEVIKTINEIYRDMPQQSMWDGTKGKN